jgi:DNA-binding transcriptional MerR regulator/methylmalonyl-CoA mutase cobalamin-binding subunit
MMEGNEKGYPIRAVAQLTGLSVDTLRAWERRYKAVSPQRQGRGRVYNEGDIERLTLLKNAVDRGHSIGRIAALSDEKLLALLNRSAELASRPEKTAVGASSTVEWNRIIEAIERYDYAETDREISRLAALLMPQELIHQVMVPLMTEVGDRWHKGRFNIAQEHMISAVLNNLLGSLIRMYTREDTPCRILFAAPAGEQHVFGIMTAAMLAARGGLGIIYLGAEMPAEDILDAATKGKVSGVVLGVKGVNGRDTTIQHLKTLAQNLPRHIELWIGGQLDHDLKQATERPAGRRNIMVSLLQLEAQLIRLGARF